jgi:hypothetical protein
MSSGRTAMRMHAFNDALARIEETLQAVDTRLHMVEHAMDVYVEELNIIKDKLK